jgi:hypothetical protein
MMTITSIATEKTTAAFDDNNDYDFDKKLQIVTAGLERYFATLLKNQSNQNALTIADYLLALNTEINPSLAYKSNQLKALCYLSTFYKQLY